jgi:hypothetical protein
MPEGGYYEKRPRPESIQYFMNRVNGHTKVLSVKKIGDQLFEIKQRNGKIIYVYLTNIYIIGEAEVYEILAENKENHLDSIVTISSWNQVSSAGKQAGKDNGLGIFIMSDFLGALNYDGEAFTNYISPAEREENKSSFGRY